MDFILSAVTDVGISKQTNQDSFLLKSANTKIGKVVLAVVCDGMGGLSKGELASATVINAFNNWFTQELPQLIEFGFQDNLIRQQWTKLVVNQNDKIMAYGKSCKINLGTTVCAILLTQNRFWYLNVGDSRLYEISSQVRQITTDQTLVQREVEMGKITPEQAHVDPRRSVLLQCVGCNDTVNPVIESGTPQINATYLLCSDGFRHEITDAEMAAYLSPANMTSKEDMAMRIRQLIELNKQRQENDNITAVAVRTF